jgi:hypothetical protein
MCCPAEACGHLAVGRGRQCQLWKLTLIQTTLHTIGLLVHVILTIQKFFGDAAVADAHFGRPVI